MSRKAVVNTISGLPHILGGALFALYEIDYVRALAVDKLLYGVGFFGYVAMEGCGP